MPLSFSSSPMTLILPLCTQGIQHALQKFREGKTLLHVLLFSAQTRPPQVIPQSYLWLLTSRCIENMHSTVPMYRSGRITARACQSCSAPPHHTPAVPIVPSVAPGRRCLSVGSNALSSWPPHLFFPQPSRWASWRGHSQSVLTVSVLVKAGGKTIQSKQCIFFVRESMIWGGGERRGANVLRDRREAEYRRMEARTPGDLLGLKTRNSWIRASLS